MFGHNEHSYWYTPLCFFAVLQVQPHISTWLCGVQAWQHQCAIDLIRSPFPLADRSWLEAPDVPYVILLPAAMQSGQSSMISTHWQLGMAKVPIGARGEEWQADAPNTALHTKGAAETWAPEEKENSRVLCNSGGKWCQSKRNFRARIPPWLFCETIRHNGIRAVILSLHCSIITYSMCKNLNLCRLFSEKKRYTDEKKKKLTI